MSKRQFKGFWLVQCSFLFALYLQALPMPPTLLYFRPEWLGLMLIFWSLSLPQRVGIFHGFIWGLLLDLVEGTLLGHNAVVLALLGYLTNIFYQRIRMYSLVKQAALVFILLSIGQLVFQWLQGFLGAMSGLSYLLLPSLISAVLWPWLFTLMQGIKRYFNLG